MKRENKEQNEEEFSTEHARKKDRVTTALGCVHRLTEPSRAMSGFSCGWWALSREGILPRAAPLAREGCRGAVSGWTLEVSPWKGILGKPV